MNDVRLLILVVIRQLETVETETGNEKNGKQKWSKLDANEY